MFSDRDKVYDNLIDFKHIISSVLNNQFHQTLPKKFKPTIDFDTHKKLGPCPTKRNTD